VAAAWSRDPVLVDAYERDIDVHTLTAAKIRRIPVEAVTKEQRNPAKTTNFLALYGGGAFQLARSVKIPYSEAEDFLFDYWHTMSRLGEYIEESKERGRKRGYVETMFGRRVHVPHIYSKDPDTRKSGERLCVSGEVSGTAADICRKAMIDVAPKLLVFRDADLLIQCHDELIVECDERDAEDVRDVLRTTMETCVDIGIPIKADAKIGRSWKELK